MAGMGGPAEKIKVKFAAMEPLLDERTRRIWAAVEAKALGRSGISQVAESTGLSRNTVRSGLRESEAGRWRRGRVRGCAVPGALGEASSERADGQPPAGPRPARARQCPPRPASNCAP